MSWKEMPGDDPAAAQWGGLRSDPEPPASPRPPTKDDENSVAYGILLALAVAAVTGYSAVMLGQRGFPVVPVTVAIALAGTGLVHWGALRASRPAILKGFWGAIAAGGVFVSVVFYVCGTLFGGWY